MNRSLARLFAVSILAFALPAVAQPTSECPPESPSSAADVLRGLGDVIEAAPAPKARDLAETVMKTLLDDTKPGEKDRWGFTSDTGDGCFARSYATNYDMATGVFFGPVPDGITFKSIYIYWKNHSWRYHTAAVISGPDGDFVVDALNGEVLTAQEWLDSWRMGDKFDRSELKDGMYMYPSESHDGKPSLDRRKQAHEFINGRKRLKNVPTYPYEEGPRS